jgi:uncharacterized protein (DUF1684 family)
MNAPIVNELPHRCHHLGAGEVLSLAAAMPNADDDPSRAGAAAADPLAGAGADADPFAAAADEFRRARYARLTSETGWLTLVARYPLDRGDNPLPIGTVTLDERGAVRLVVTPGLDVTCAGQPVRERALRADGDAGGGPADVIKHGRLTYELVRRGDAISIRVRDPDNPLRRSFAGTDWFPARREWCVPATLERLPEPRLTSVPYDFGPVMLPSPGTLVFEAAGHACRLQALLDDDGRRLFVLFGDATNRDLTYGAGRFLYAPLPDAATGRVAIDFNHALNPGCVFNALAICPLPPPQNRLPFRVEAGEKRYQHDDEGGGAADVAP